MLTLGEGAEELLVVEEGGAELVTATEEVPATAVEVLVTAVEVLATAVDVAEVVTDEGVAGVGEILSVTRPPCVGSTSFLTGDAVALAREAVAEEDEEARDVELGEAAALELVVALREIEDADVTATEVDGRMLELEELELEDLAAEVDAEADAETEAPEPETPPTW